MNTCFRWLILALTIGGGFIGLILVGEATTWKDANGLFGHIVLGVEALLYVLSIVSGLLFADNPQSITLLRVIFFLQLPSVSSPLFVYYFTSGFRVFLGITGWRFVANYTFGSGFGFFMFGKHPWGIGINFVALLILVVLARHSRTPDTALAPTPIKGIGTCSAN